MTGAWLDRLALRMVSRQDSGEIDAENDGTLLGRAEFLRQGAVGALVLATGGGGLGVRRAAASNSSAAAATACNGGSLAGCYSESNKTFKATLAFCSKAFHDRFDALGCIVETVDARAAGASNAGRPALSRRKSRSPARAAAEAERLHRRAAEATHPRAASSTAPRETNAAPPMPGRSAAQSAAT